MRGGGRNIPSSFILHHLKPSDLVFSFSVVRAKVLAQKLTNETDHLQYNLRILKTYKGAAELNQTEGIKVHGSRGRSLYANAHTASDDTLCGVPWLQNGTVYLLAGHIHRNTLWLSLCSWNQVWSSVTDRQRAGIRRFYGENCECNVGWCGACTGKLKGCDTPKFFHYNTCELLHSYCLKNSDNNACSWRETAGYKKCISQP